MGHPLSSDRRTRGSVHITQTLAVTAAVSVLFDSALTHTGVRLSVDTHFHEKSVWFTLDITTGR